MKTFLTSWNATLVYEIQDIKFCIPTYKISVSQSNTVYSGLLGSWTLSAMLCSFSEYDNDGTREAMYIQDNTVLCSCNHCYNRNKTMCPMCTIQAHHY